MTIETPNAKNPGETRRRNFRVRSLPRFLRRFLLNLLAPPPGTTDWRESRRGRGPRTIIVADGLGSASASDPQRHFDAWLPKVLPDFENELGPMVAIRGFSYVAPGFGYGPPHTIQWSIIDESVDLVLPYLPATSEQQITYCGFSVGGAILLKGLADAARLGYLPDAARVRLVLIQPALELGETVIPLVDDMMAGEDRWRMFPPPTLAEYTRGSAKLHQALLDALSHLLSRGIVVYVLAWTPDEFTPYDSKFLDLSEDGCSERWLGILLDNLYSDRDAFTQHGSVRDQFRGAEISFSCA